MTKNPNYMSHTQNNQRHPIALQLPRRSPDLLYQNFPEETSSPSEDRRNEDIQNNQHQEHHESIAIASEIGHESLTQTELKQAVNRFMDKCWTNQFYILLLLLATFGGSFCLIGVGVFYVIDLIRALCTAQTQNEVVRIEYKIYEAMGVIVIMLLWSHQYKRVFICVLAISLLVSYMIKAVLAYRCNQSARVNFINNVNKAVLTIRRLIAIQWMFELIQVAFHKPLSPYIARLPLLGIMLIILKGLFIVYYTRIWNSISSKRIKGALWIFGNMISLIVFLLFSYFRSPDSSREELDLGSISIFAIWCAISLVFSSHAREGVLEICCELVSILESNQEPIQEPNQYLDENDLPRYVIKITHTLFLPMTEKDVAEFVDRNRFEDTDKEAQRKNENQDNIKCLKCGIRYANAMFMGCGHGGLCISCAKKRNRRQKDCHLCTQEIKAVLAMDIENNREKWYQIVESVLNREDKV